MQIPKTKFKKTESVSIEYNEFVVCITAIINAFDVFYRIYNTIVHNAHATCTIFNTVSDIATRIPLFE